MNPHEHSSPLEGNRIRITRFNTEDDVPFNSNSDEANEGEFEEDPDMEVDSMHSDESFTLRDRQNAINKSHPFGIRLWKPALYKKKRSVEQNAEDDILSKPNRHVPWYVTLGNWLWTFAFGIVLFFTIVMVYVPLRVLGLMTGSKSAKAYAELCYQLAWFFLFPFGKSVGLMYNENYRLEDDGHGRPVSDYMAWQSGNAGDSIDRNHLNSLFFAPHGRRPSMNGERPQLRSRFFGRGKWTLGRIMFYIGYYTLIVPVGYFIFSLCWLNVVGVPMARVIAHMLHHMRIHPLSLNIRKSSWYNDTEANRSNSQYSIILCTYRAFGMKYFKYTVGGNNIVLLNMLSIVLFTIVDSYSTKILNEETHFFLSLVSIIPLAHFIGQAVASISAQSSMSMGATINAFFSTLVEVYLYSVALRQGKGELVEGSIVGSLLAGVLLMPGMSMFAGAFKCKTQKFNPKSAGATSTMLLFTVAGVLAPTIFHNLYGPSEVDCTDNVCWEHSVPITTDSTEYVKIIKPFAIMCAIGLFITYAIGLLFTLRTHAAHIWNEEIEQESAEEGANWSRTKSYVILVSCTIAYALISEVLVNSVDGILQHVKISQRMLGLTVFALVPNTAEFLNAISFAIYGNVSLSLEIGSAYALQVCLLQVPALVFSSLPNAAHIPKGYSLRDYVFILLFPKWDTWAWVVSILLYCHVHAEGRSNYFKGSILVLAYLVLTAGFYYNDVLRDMPSLL